MSEQKSRTFIIRAGIKRRYGDHEIYFEISEQVEIANGQDRRDAFMNLNAQLEDQVNVYEAVSLPHVRLPQGSVISNGNGIKSDTFPLQNIIVESKQGKRFVFATGGAWTKFGVPVYPDCDTELDIEKLDYGSHDFKHLNVTVTAEFKDGKPKRARSIK